MFVFLLLLLIAALTPEQRVLRARLAAHTLHSQADPSAHTAPARAKFLQRFEAEVDPDQVLRPDERARRAQHALKAHMTRLSFASSQARRKRGAA